MLRGKLEGEYCDLRVGFLSGLLKSRKLTALIQREQAPFLSH